MSPTKPLPQGEFIALLAMLFATVALTIDAVLPALPLIAQSLSPQDANRAQLVITSFVFGMGLGTLFAGPLSDRFGRKIIVQLGLLIYATAAVMCYFAPNLELLLAARVLQGIGVSAPRTVGLAIVRDLYSGRQMARIVSFAQMIFTSVPAIAPLLGLGIMTLSSWHEIFLGYLGFALICALWFGLRQPETLPKAARRSLALGRLWSATIEMFRSPSTTVSILIQSLTTAMLFSTLSSIQGVFDQYFGRAGSFPMWFFVIAVVSMLGSIVNARVVMQVGMRQVLVWTYAAQFAVSVAVLLMFGSKFLPPTAEFAVFILWAIGLFAMMGTTMGNLNALALEPLGHISGLVASVMSSISTVVSVAIAIPVGLLFNGTPLPLMASITALAAGALLLARFGLVKSRA